MIQAEIAAYQKQYDRNLKDRIALQCAPVLMGVKTANTLIVPLAEEESVKAVFHEKAIAAHLLFHGEGKAFFLVYDHVALSTYLTAGSQRSFMNEMGYDNLKLEAVLGQLSERYQFYMQHREGFPHEIGILLGYPVNDVADFIRNKGKNYNLSGYWKVYHDLPQALSVFKSYDEAKRRVLEKIKRGNTLEQLIDRIDERHFNKATDGRGRW